MCDFHSTAWRMIGQDIQVTHTPDNSHSGMINKVGWRVNEPNRKAIVFEVEWNGRGAMPSDTKLIRQCGECPEPLVKRIREHYRKLAETLKTGKHLLTYFADIEKWSDVWSKVTSLPENVKFPETVSGGLYLRENLQRELAARNRRKKAVR